MFSLIILRLISRYFLGNFNETWNSTLNQFDGFVANLSLYLSCFEFNKFVGMPNEYKLEELGKLQDCQFYFDKKFQI